MKANSKWSAAQVSMLSIILFSSACIMQPGNPSAQAASIFANDINDANPSGSNPFTTGQTVAPNMTANGIGRGAGLGANSGGNRYNANGWTSGGIDLTDYFTWTLTPNSGFSLDLTSLSGNWQRSSTGANTYALRSSLDGFSSTIATGAITGSATVVPFSLDLTAAAFNAVNSAIEFRLYGFAAGAATGTFSVNDFIFDGAVNSIAAGNNSIITAPASDSFGRVMLGQTPSRNISLSKTGTDTTTYSATASNNGLGVTADGAIGAGSVNETVGLQLLNNANGSASTGVKAYTLTIDNTAGNSAAAGQGSLDPNDSVSVGATVVTNRVVTASAVNLGNVIVGHSTGAQNSSLSTLGDDNNNTRVTVNGTAAISGEVTVAAGSSQLFDAGGDGATRSVSATFATAGPKSGNVQLSVTGEGLAGEAVNGVSVPFSANAYDPSQAAFLSNDGTALAVDFGEFRMGSGIQSIGEAIYNVLQTAGFTAELDFDTVSGSGDLGVLYTDLTDGAFTGRAAGEPNAFDFVASFDTNNARGNYSATYTFGLSDANTYVGAGAAGSQTVTLSMSGSIVPEPSTMLLAAFSLCGAVGLTRRVRRS